MESRSTEGRAAFVCALSGVRGALRPLDLSGYTMAARRALKDTRLSGAQSAPGSSG